MSRIVRKALGQRRTIGAGLVVLAAVALLLLAWLTPGSAQTGGGNSTLGIEYISTNCVEGSVTPIAPTNSPVACVGSNVTLTATVEVRPAITTIITTYGDGTSSTNNSTNAPSYGVTWDVSGVEAVPTTNYIGLTASFTNLTCGDGTVTFTCNYTNKSPCSEIGSLSVPVSFKAVGVASLAPDGNPTPFTNPPPTYVYCVSSNAVKVVAASCPPLSADQLPDGWSISPDNGSNKLEAYVWLTNAGRYEVIAQAGTSALTNVISVEGARLGLATTNVFVNQDDDNANGTNDLAEFNGEAGLVVSNENDLVLLTLQVQNPAQSNEVVYLNVSPGPSSSGGRVRVWASPLRGPGVPLLDNTSASKLSTNWPFSAMPTNLWVEGVSASVGINDVTFTLQTEYSCSVSTRVTVSSLAFLDASKSSEADVLKVAKWENGFDAGPMVKTNFIDLDPDRFYVQVNDQTQKGSGKVSVKSSTDSPGTAYDDDATTIELNEEPPNSGIFVSSSMMLVSDDVDDDFTNAYVVADDTVNDRTHKVALGGKAKVQYPETATVLCEKEVNVPPIPKTVTINVIVLRDKAFADGGTPVADLVTVSNHWKLTCERYAQAAVKVDWSLSVADPPAGVNLANGIAAAASTNEHKVSTEMRALIDGLGTGTNSTDFHAFYVSGLYWTNSPALDPLYGVGIANYWFDPSEDGYLHNAIMNNTTVTGGKLFNPAHEVGHCLTDAAHHGDAWNIMATPTSTSNTPTGTKRFNNAQGGTIYNEPHCN